MVSNQAKPVIALSAPLLVNTVPGTLTTPNESLTATQTGGDAATTVSLAFGDGTSNGAATSLPQTFNHPFTITNGLDSQLFTTTANASNAGGSAVAASQTLQVVQSPAAVLFISGQPVTEGETIRIAGHNPITLIGSGSTGYITAYAFADSGTTLQSGSQTGYLISDPYAVHNQPLHFTVSNAGTGVNSSTLDFTITSPVPVLSLSLPAKVNTVPGTLTTPTQTVMPA